MAKLKTGRHTSAIKTYRQSLRRAVRNRALKKTLRLEAKGLLAAAGSKDAPKVQELLKSVSSAFDKAAKGNTIHWKTAARKKSRLAAQARKLLAATPAS